MQLLECKNLQTLLNKNTLNKAQNYLTAELKKKPLINNFFERESPQNENESNKLSNRSNVSL